MNLTRLRWPANGLAPYLFLYRSVVGLPDAEGNENTHCASVSARNRFEITKEMGE